MKDGQNSIGFDPVDKVLEAARTSRDTFGQLFGHFYLLIFVYCSRRLLVPAVVEDVTSEVFLKVAAHFSGISGSSAEDFRRWVFRIATDELNTQLRQSIIRREMLEAAVRMGTVNSEVSTRLLSSDTPVDWEDIRVVLNELSEREPSIILLRFFAGLKPDQIADVLSIEAGTSRVTLPRALVKLRDHLRLLDQPRRSSPVAEQRGHEMNNHSHSDWEGLFDQLPADTDLNDEHFERLKNQVLKACVDGPASSSQRSEIRETGRFLMKYKARDWSAAAFSGKYMTKAGISKDKQSMPEQIQQIVKDCQVNDSAM